MGTSKRPWPVCLWENGLKVEVHRERGSPWMNLGKDHAIPRSGISLHRTVALIGVQGSPYRKVPRYVNTLAPLIITIITIIINKSNHQ
jgi:hypothetical protein